ncbi:MAG: peptidoglycan-binding protein [Pseudomonadota bacterium]
MAVRGAGGPGTFATPQVQAVASNLSQMFAAAGMSLSPRDAMALAQHIVKNLVAQGYGAKPQGQLEQQLKQVLQAAQRSHGLNMSGKLDNPTMALLRSLGVVATQTSGPKGVLENKDGFVRQASTRNAPPEASPKTEQAVKQSLVENLASLLERNLGDLGKRLGSLLLGLAARGEALGDQVRQALDGLRGAAGEAAARIQGRGAEGQPQAALPPASVTTAQVATSVAAPAAAQVQNGERARSESLLATKDPKDRGAPVGDALSDQGKGKQGQHAGMLGGGEGEGAPEETGEDDGLSTDPDDDGSERDTGNAPSGDENFADPERGHAQLDDGSAAGEGYYEIPAFEEQVLEALAAIVRDPESATRATTYSWDLVLYKPGVYGAGQKGEELVHLEVQNATPFDPVWDKARGEIGRILRRYQPGALPPSRAEIEVALRRARVREA